MSSAAYAMHSQQSLKRPSDALADRTTTYDLDPDPKNIYPVYDSNGDYVKSDDESGNSDTQDGTSSSSDNDAGDDAMPPDWLVDAENVLKAENAADELDHLSTTPTPKDVVQNLFRKHVRSDASWNCGNQGKFMSGIRETMESVARRVHVALDRVAKMEKKVADETYGTPFIIGHGGINRAILRQYGIFVKHIPNCAMIGFAERRVGTSTRFDVVQLELSEEYKALREIVSLLPEIHVKTEEDRIKLHRLVQATRLPTYQEEESVLHLNGAPMKKMPLTKFLASLSENTSKRFILMRHGVTLNNEGRYLTSAMESGGRDPKVSDTDPLTNCGILRSLMYTPMLIDKFMHAESGSMEQPKKVVLQGLITNNQYLCAYRIEGEPCDGGGSHGIDIKKACRFYVSPMLRTLQTFVALTCTGREISDVCGIDNIYDTCVDDHQLHVNIVHELQEIRQSVSDDVQVGQTATRLRKWIQDTQASRGCKELVYLEKQLNDANAYNNALEDINRRCMRKDKGRTHGGDTATGMQLVYYKYDAEKDTTGCENAIDLDMRRSEIKMYKDSRSLELLKRIFPSNDAPPKNCMKTYNRLRTILNRIDDTEDDTPQWLVDDTEDDTPQWLVDAERSLQQQTSFAEVPRCFQKVDFMKTEVGFWKMLKQLFLKKSLTFAGGVQMSESDMQCPYSSLNWSNIVLRITLYMTSNGSEVDSLTTFRTLLFKYVIILSLLTQDRQDRISALDIALIGDGLVHQKAWATRFLTSIDDGVQILEAKEAETETKTTEILIDWESLYKNYFRPRREAFLYMQKQEGTIDNIMFHASNEHDTSRQRLLERLDSLAATQQKPTSGFFRGSGLQDMPKDIRSLIHGNLSCKDIANLCLSNSKMCEFMKQIDYTGEGHERKMFEDFARCLLKEANSNLREIERNYPKASKKIAEGDEMLKILGRIEPGTYVNVNMKREFELGKSGVIEVKVTGNNFRDRVRRGIENGEIYHPNMMEMPPEVKFPDFGRTYYSWNIEGKHENGTVYAAQLHFDDFTLSEYIDYEINFTINYFTIKWHDPGSWDVGGTFGRFGCVPLHNYKDSVTNLYTAIGALLGIKGKLSFRITVFERGNHTNPDYRYSVFYDGIFPEFLDNNIILSLPIFQYDRNRVVLKYDKKVEDWDSKDLFIERARRSKRQKKIPERYRSA